MKTKGKIWFLAVLASLSAPIAAQGLLIGKVFASADRQMLAGTSVQLYDEDGALLLSTTTGYDGRYTSDTLPAGLYFISLEREGFQKVEKQAIRIFSGATRLEWSLKALPKETQDPAIKPQSPMLGLLNRVLENAVGPGPW
jgi:hypothetical protein